jgi:hypothetical protein
METIKKEEFRIITTKNNNGIDRCLSIDSL